MLEPPQSTPSSASILRILLKSLKRELVTAIEARLFQAAFGLIVPLNNAASLWPRTLCIAGGAIGRKTEVVN